MTVKGSLLKYDPEAFEDEAEDSEDIEEDESPRVQRKLDKLDKEIENDYL